MKREFNELAQNSVFLDVISREIERKNRATAKGIFAHALEAQEERTIGKKKPKFEMTHDEYVQLMHRIVKLESDVAQLQMHEHYHTGGYPD